MKNKESELEMNKKRSPDFQRNKELEEVLRSTNNLLSTLDTGVTKPDKPVIFIMGVPRCGSTLTLQWFSSLGEFAYPSNLIARFYGNPYLGVKIQKILLDLDNQNQLGLKGSVNDFKSMLGKTSGALSPSEFWYFWRQFYDFGEIQILTDDELKKVDTSSFVHGIGGMEEASGLPVVLKGMILNWHIPHLNSLFDKAIFINIERDDFFNAQSLYFARKQFYGNVNNWFSYKPEEYSFLKEASPLQQVAGQVVFTKNAIKQGMDVISSEKKITISYKDFCENPIKLYHELAGKMSLQGYDLPGSYSGIDSYAVHDMVKLTHEEQVEINDALVKYSR